MSWGYDGIEIDFRVRSLILPEGPAAASVSASLARLPSMIPFLSKVLRAGRAIVYDPSIINQVCVCVCIYIYIYYIYIYILYILYIYIYTYRII